MVPQCVVAMIAFGVPKHEEFFHEFSLSGGSLKCELQFLCLSRFGRSKRGNAFCHSDEVTSGKARIRFIR
jgi:hypothetical protein